MEAWVVLGGVACWHKSFWRCFLHYHYHSLAKLQGGNTAPLISRKLDYRFTEHGLAHQSKTQFSSQLVLPIRKLPQAFYPSPSEGRQNENHNHWKLTKLITWITALSNSMKLWAMLCRATQDRWVIVQSSDKTWSTGEVNGKPLQHSCFGNPMDSMKRQKDITLKHEFLRLVGDQYAAGEEWKITPERMKQLSQSGNTQLGMCLVVKVKSNAVKNNIA